MGLFDIFKKQESLRSERAQIEVDAKRMDQSAFDAMFGRDENFYRIAELNRQATALGDAGNLDAAVACLRQVAELNASTIKMTPTEGMRLPLYLQKAGRGDEAVQEMRRLIAMVPGAIEMPLPNGKRMSAREKDRTEASLYADLHDKLRLIFQREKRKDERDETKLLAEQWRNRSGALYQRDVMKAEIKIPPRPSHPARN
jgi:hypothetical protein